MKHIQLALCSMFLMAVSGIAFAADASKTENAETAAARSTSLDNQFIKDVARENTLLTRLGDIADKQAGNHAIKAFGHMEAQRHADIEKSLRKLAKDKKVDLPRDLEGMRQITLQRFTNLNGDAFDKPYMRDMILEHNLLIANFQYMLDNTTDPDVKKFVRDTLPGLQDHLRVAQDDAKTINLNMLSTETQP